VGRGFFQYFEQRIGSAMTRVLKINHHSDFHVPSIWLQHKLSLQLSHLIDL
jgi:hypothetical protein